MQVRIIHTSAPSTLGETVISGGYCVGCGACAAVRGSPFEMVMTPSGWYLPVKPETATEPDSIANVCPFFNHGQDEDSLVPDGLRAGAEHHPDVGWYRAIFAGHANEGDFRSHGSSGGLTNWLAAELLKSGKVDGVIHVKNAPADRAAGVLFEYAISKDPAGLDQGAKSKYYPIELSGVIEHIRQQPGRYAFIGVPCFVKAVRLLAQTDPSIRDSVKFCIALFCGHLKSRNFAEHAAWQLGIEPADLQTFDFRTKLDDRPANRYGVTATGKVNGEIEARTRPTSELQGSDWGEGYFKLRACDYCDDIVGETADASMGDAWLPQFVQDSNGTNIVVVRNAELASLFEMAHIDGRTHAEPARPADVRASQRSNYRHRRESLGHRLQQLDSMACWHPVKRAAFLDLPISEQRKRVTDLRAQLRDASHDFYLTARKAHRLTLFSDLMAPLQRLYQQSLDEERRLEGKRQTKSNVKPGHGGAAPRIASRVKLHGTRLRRALRPRRRSALVLPPTTPGSLGDDAMLCATFAELRKRGFHKIGLLQHGPSHDLSFSVNGDESYDLSDYFGANKVRTALKLLQPLASYDYLFIVGADVLDGYYSDQRSYLRLNLGVKAEQLGLTTTLLGFSYNESPGKLALQAMKQLGPRTRICVRDPVSRIRLNTLLDHPTEQVADVAFLLKPEPPSDQQLISWLDTARSARAPLIGINAVMTTSFFSDKRPESQKAYVQFYVDLINSIAAEHPDSQYLFIPHDYRPNGVGEGPILEHLYFQLPAGVRARVRLLSGRHSAAQIKWIAGQLDFIVSSRMHLAIAAIGQTTPVFCFEYQGKFQGLFNLIKQPDMLASMESVLSEPNRLIQVILDDIRRAPQLRAHLHSVLPEIVALSERNFDLPGIR